MEKLSKTGGDTYAQCVIFIPTKLFFLKNTFYFVIFSRDTIYMTDLSVVIITHNEASNIERCLNSVLRISSDIIVIDSFSTDNTIALCKEYNLTVEQKKWEGYASQKNYGNMLAKNDWVLSIDADEEISEELAKEILAEFKEPHYNCYEIDFRTNFCGKWLSYGHWNPEKHIRIFNKKEVQWNTDAVHEGLIVRKSMSVKRFKGKIYHYTIKSLDQYRKKNDYYIELAAKKMAAKNKKAGFIKLYLSPAYRFVHSYFLKLGFLDGYYGYVIAKETARVAYLKYDKIHDYTK
jgi:glycosyltransferase involved in cell wall biosynthesis